MTQTPRRPLEDPPRPETDPVAERLARLERRLEHLAQFWRCALPRCSILGGMLHRGHAAGKPRSTSCSSTGLQRIAGYLFTHLRRSVRNPARAATARRIYSSGDVPGRSRDHCFPSPLWPCGYHPWRIGWCRLWGFGAGAVGSVCNTAPWGMAKPDRLGRHRPDLGRCLSRKWRTVAEPEAGARRSTSVSERKQTRSTLFGQTHTDNESDSYCEVSSLYCAVPAVAP